MCGKCIKSNQKALLCDLCDKWSHILCVGVSEIRYRELSEATEDLNWHCPLCLFKQLPCSNLSNSNIHDDLGDIHPVHSPTRSLLCLCFNARGIISKRLDLVVLLEECHPDIVVITETFLDNSFLDSELFSAQYAVFRKDRNRHGGGVLIAVRQHISAVRWVTSELSNIELIWLRVVSGSSSFMLGGFYRPPGSPESYLLELQSSLHSLPSNSSIVLCGDFNVLNVSWETVSPTSGDKSAAVLCTMINHFFMEQCVHSPTRGSNILDLLLTNRPSH